MSPLVYPCVHPFLCLVLRKHHYVIRISSQEDVSSIKPPQEKQVSPVLLLGRPKTGSLPKKNRDAAPALWFSTKPLAPTFFRLGRNLCQILVLVFIFLPQDTSFCKGTQTSPAAPPLLKAFSSLSVFHTRAFLSSRLHPDFWGDIVLLSPCSLGSLFFCWTKPRSVPRMLPKPCSFCTQSTFNPLEAFIPRSFFTKPLIRFAIGHTWFLQQFTS